MSAQDNFVYVFIGGFIGGVFVRSVFDLGVFFSLFIALLAFAMLVLHALRRRKADFLVALVLLGAAIGVVRFDLADLDRGAPLPTGERRVFEGVVVDEPDERESNTKLTILVDQVGGGVVKRKALVTTARRPEYSYGDRLRIAGEFERPAAFVGDDGLFDYAAYLGKDDIGYVAYYPEIEFVGSGEGNLIKQTLFDIKEALLLRVERVVPEPQASLLGGLVVGAKQSLGGQLLDDFRRTGIVHIVVLSGYNVTIVAEFIMRVLSFLPLAATWSLGVGAIVLFALATGASATIVRASIMAILVVVARATGRTYAMGRALALAGFLMVLHNPKILAFDSSFQLSFMATVGLIYLAPALERYFGWLPTKWQLREFATATIATQLFVLPLLLYNMGEVSTVALPVNLLILPVIPLTMLLGFLTGVAGFVGVVLSLPFSYVATALLSYQLFVVDLFARLPFASLSVQNFPLWGMVLLYMVYGAVLLKIHRSSED